MDLEDLLKVTQPKPFYSNYLEPFKGNQPGMNADYQQGDNNNGHPESGVDVGQQN